MKNQEATTSASEAPALGGSKGHTAHGGAGKESPPGWEPRSEPQGSLALLGAHLRLTRPAPPLRAHAGVASQTVSRGQPRAVELMFSPFNVLCFPEGLPCAALYLWLERQKQ